MTGYCKYCDRIIDDSEIICAFNDNHQMVWSGCLNCYEKRTELKNNAEREQN